jgi:thioredoxin-like negative regulator of GroEL
VLEHIGVPKFNPSIPIHKRLADLSHRAHELGARLAAKPDDEEAKRELAEVEDQVDRAAAELWGLTDAELQEIRTALEVLG